MQLTTRPPRGPPQAPPASHRALGRTPCSARAVGAAKKAAWLQPGAARAAAGRKLTRLYSALLWLYGSTLQYVNPLGLRKSVCHTFASCKPGKTLVAPCLVPRVTCPPRHACHVPWSCPAALRPVDLGPVGTMMYPVLVYGTLAAALAAMFAPGLTGELTSYRWYKGVGMARSCAEATRHKVVLS